MASRGLGLQQPQNDKLREWLVAFLKYGPQPNYCVVTSEAVSEQDCNTFAAQFRSALQGTPVVQVDYEPPMNRLPLVLPFEYTDVQTAQLHRRKLTLTPPSSRVFGRMGLSESWFVDIVDDSRTGRAVREMELPPSTIVAELLNGPCPPGIGHSLISRFGQGVDSINIRCDSRKGVVNFHIPSPQEVLEELLREQSYEIIQDEKRSSYLPTIKRFGSLHQAAAAFSGRQGGYCRH